MAPPAAALDLCNLALLNLKQKPLTSLSDTDSFAAVVMNTIYDQVRQQILQEVSWNCARTYGQLNLVANQAPPFDYGGVYQLPIDLIALRQLGNQADQWDLMHKYAYEIVESYLYFGSATAPVIPPPNVLNAVYTRDLQDVTQMDPLFKKVLVRGLSAEAAFMITGDLKMAEVAEKRYQMARAEALAANRQARPIRIIDRNPISEAGWHQYDDGWDGQLTVPPTAWPSGPDAAE